jgi:hypothetical protein
MAGTSLAMTMVAAVDANQTDEFASRVAVGH